MQKKRQRKTARRFTKKEIAEREIHYPDYSEIKNEVLVIDRYIKEDSKKYVRLDALFGLITFVGVFLSAQIILRYMILGTIILLCAVGLSIWQHYRFIKKRKIRKAWKKKRIGIEYMQVVKDSGTNEEGVHSIETEDITGTINTLQVLSQDEYKENDKGIALYMFTFFDRPVLKLFIKRDEIPEKKITKFRNAKSRIKDEKENEKASD